MYKHLFLEADSGAGKSTLIRKLISPYVDQVGGFSSQRLLDSSGSTIAFRIVSADDLRLAVPFDDTPKAIFRTLSNDNTAQSFPKIFDSEGMRLLNESVGKKLLLLDEIGGIELKSSLFKDKLIELLSSDIPCIGVIKQAKKAKSMDAGSISEANTMLRKQMLEEFNCKILDFKRNDPAVENEVMNFINRIFK